MEEIKVENNDVVDTTKPAEETTPATPSEEVKTEDTTEATDEKKDNSDKILVITYTDEFLDDKNFIELERIRKANLRNKDTLYNMKITVEGMAKFYKENFWKQLMSMELKFMMKHLNPIIRIFLSFSIILRNFRKHMILMFLSLKQMIRRLMNSSKRSMAM